MARVERVAVDDVEPAALGDAERRGLADPLGATHLAVNHYALAPGERGSGLHAHLDQEEVFVVVEGRVTFETLDGRVGVGTDVAVRFAPGEYHSGPIADDGVGAAALALGAPRDSEAIRIPLPCPHCSHDARRPALAEDRRTPVLVCPDCGVETDATCPECGNVEMHATLAEDGETVVGGCRSCGAVTTG